MSNRKSGAARAMWMGSLASSLMTAALPAAVRAQTVLAAVDQTCAADRLQPPANLSPCTAGDFSSVVNVTNSTAATCTNGGFFTADLNVTFTHNQGNVRYDVGFFVGQANNDPKMAGAGMCSVATFPLMPAPWLDSEPAVMPPDTCGDFQGPGAANATIQGVKLACNGAVGSQLTAPYLILWQQNSGPGCTGPSDVKTDTGSKCTGGTFTITNVTVQNGADLSMDKQVQINGNNVTYTLTISNAGPNDAFDGADYADTVPATVSIVDASCTGTTGGAACGAMPNVNGQDVTGTTGNIPVGGTVTITITGTAPNNSDVGNTATVMPVTSGPNNVSDPDNTNNSGTATDSTTPVMLQKFDVSQAGSPYSR